jgi:hypothetical protein
MRRFIDNLGVFHLLLDGETPQETWTEVIDQYKRYKAPNGDVHTILFDAEPEEGWVEDNIEYMPYPDPSYVPPYGALRKMSYPDLGEQLDMLWHEINENGSISSSGQWFQSISDVKTQFPKDEE